MTVKELISKLIDMHMNAEVRLVGVAPHIDEDGDICKGYYFHIDDVKQWPDGVEIEFKDYLRSNGDLSDGYHTFNQLYYQRMMLFAVLVKQNRDKAWKSLRHEDGELCFGGGWFIVGIDTPEGSYTYHYENKYFDLFDCEILDHGKHWDGHTEKDVTRLLSLEQEPTLDKIRERVELEKLGYPPSAEYYKAIMKVLQIIDNERETKYADDRK